MSLIELALQKARAGGISEIDRPTLEGKPDPVSRLPVPSAPSNPAPAEEVVAVASPVPELVITDAFLREKGLRAPEDQERQQRAEYRIIKRGLLADLRDPTVNRMVLVTSALQGEGKSYSAAHLALALALEPDFTITLVDADVIRPRLSRVFGLSDRLGLMDAVADPQLDVQALIIPTNIPGFSILPAGQPNENATEFFASERMRLIMKQLLATPNRIVVVDSLPLLLTTEARALASAAGEILLVVRAESTPQSAVLRAIETLGEGVNVKLLLNAIVRTKFTDYLGMGYGYNYDKPENLP